MNNRPERRRDIELRSIIDLYENQARDVSVLADQARSALKRERLLSLANSLTQLAAALKGRSF